MIDLVKNQNGYIPKDFTYPQAVEHIVNNRLHVALAYLDMVERAETVGDCRALVSKAKASLDKMLEQLRGLDANRI